MASAIAQAIEPRVPRRSRILEARAMVRAPGAASAGAYVLTRLSPRLRLRQVWLRRLLLSSLDSVARGDIEAWVAHYRPDAIHEWSPGLRSLGFPERAVGRDEMFRAMSEWDSAWQYWTMTTRYLFDLGRRFVVLATIAGRSAGAGIDVEIEHAGIVDISRGLPSHEYDVNDWGEGLGLLGIPRSSLQHLDALPAGRALSVPLTTTDPARA